MLDLESAEKEMRRLSDLIDAGVRVLQTTTEEFATAEHDYRRARATAWLEAEGRSAAEREAIVDGVTAGARRKRDLAEGMRRAAIESIRSRQAQLSAWQSLLSAHREEASFARTGP